MYSAIDTIAPQTQIAILNIFVHKIAFYIVPQHKLGHASSYRRAVCVANHEKKKLQPGPLLCVTLLPVPVVCMVSSGVVFHVK